MGRLPGFARRHATGHQRQRHGARLYRPRPEGQGALMENERGQPQQVSLTHPKRMRFARFLRDWPLHIAAVILIVAVLIIAPRQAGILVYKASLLLIAAIGAYWINRT